MSNIHRLTELNLEIEGLLHVMEHRDNGNVRLLLGRKYDEFKSLFDELLQSPKNPEPVEEDHPHEVAQIAETLTGDEVKDQEAAEAEVVPEIDQAVEAIEKGEDKTEEKDEKEDLRVDQMLSRKEARELRKAFTINDKFRFRRELFGNNDAEFADTLNTINAMHDADEAIEYLRDDKGWDLDNEDVKDFISIVTNHFASL